MSTVSVQASIRDRSSAEERRRRKPLTRALDARRTPGPGSAEAAPALPAAGAGEVLRYSCYSLRLCLTSRDNSLPYLYVKDVCHSRGLFQPQFPVSAIPVRQVCFGLLSYPHQPSPLAIGPNFGYPVSLRTVDWVGATGVDYIRLLRPSSYSQVRLCCSWMPHAACANLLAQMCKT